MRPHLDKDPFQSRRTKRSQGNYYK